VPLGIGSGISHQHDCSMKNQAVGTHDSDSGQGVVHFDLNITWPKGVQFPREDYVSRERAINAKTRGGCRCTLRVIQARLTRNQTLKLKYAAF
jgi:hypothetical protein